MDAHVPEGRGPEGRGPEGRGTDGLVVEGLSVRLDGVPVLDDVSLVASAGRTTAVLGPSGCGKTTLLGAVCGLVPTSGGRVRVGGRDLTGVPAHRRGVGLALQDRALFPHLDVAGNVGFGLRMAGMAAAGIDARVAEVLSLVGLDGFGHRRVDSLSGGEAQRVALARALAPDPAVLCLDEPLGSLDRSLHDRLVEDLRQLFDGLSTTVLLVTHDHDEALALAEHLVILGPSPGASGGSKVLAAGAPRNVWLRPPSVAVARILGHQVFDAARVERLVFGADVWEGAPWVVVHPAAVRLLPMGGELPGELGGDVVGGVVGGVVEDVVFQGGRSMVRVSLAGEGPMGGVTLQAEVSSWGTSWGSGAAPSLGRGDRVGVSVDPSGVWGVT